MNKTKHFVVIISLLLSATNNGMKNIKIKALNKKLIPSKALNPNIIPKNVAKPQQYHLQKNVVPSVSPHASYSNTLRYFKNRIKNAISQKSIPSTGYFSTVFNSGKNNDEITNNQRLIFGKKDPHTERVALNFIKGWKRIKRSNPKNGFFQSINPKRRNREEQQKQQNARNWWFLAPLLSIFYGNKEEDDDFYPEELYKYAIDGEMAATMTPLGFVQELIKNGLTVEDAVRIACQIQEEKMFAQLCSVAQLTPYDADLLQNILDLKFQCLEGHYNENNITFDGDFAPEMMTLVKDTLQKLDVPFKVRVHSESPSSRDDTAAYVYYDDICFSFNTLRYAYFGGSIDLYKKKVDIQLYLSEWLLSPEVSLEIKTAQIAHEATHIINLHPVNRFLFSFYSNKKNIDEITYEKCHKIISTIHEYQADMLPLANPRWAKAQFAIFTARQGEELPDIYISPDKGYELSSRAVALHAEEKKIKMGFYDINSPNFMLDELKSKDEEIRATTETGGDRSTKFGWRREGFDGRHDFGTRRWRE